MWNTDPNAASARPPQPRRFSAPHRRRKPRPLVESKPGGSTGSRKVRTKVRELLLLLARHDAFSGGQRRRSDAACARIERLPPAARASLCGSFGIRTIGTAERDLFCILRRRLADESALFAIDHQRSSAVHAHVELVALALALAGTIFRRERVLAAQDHVARRGIAAVVRPVGNWRVLGGSDRS